MNTRITNARNDLLHKESTRISQNHAMIYIEDLKIANMTRSAKGTLEEPGTHVAQKSGLNRAILNQGWGIFRQQLEYKQHWLGGDVIAVPAPHTSQTCPCCQHVSRNNRLSQAEFKCVDCGYESHADVVGALNILARGRALLAGT